MGAPLGNQNAAKPKRWKLAIEKALERRGYESAKDAHDALVDIADKLLASASDGDIQALKELGNRLDGMPTQEHTGADGNPLTIVLQSYKDSEPVES